jgi:hypothetical protein
LGPQVREPLFQIRQTIFYSRASHGLNLTAMGLPSTLL